jgi:hypothetical protein
MAALTTTEIIFIVVKVYPVGDPIELWNQLKEWKYPQFSTYEEAEKRATQSGPGIFQIQKLYKGTEVKIELPIP